MRKKNIESKHKYVVLLIQAYIQNTDTDILAAETKQLRSFWQFLSMHCKPPAERFQRYLSAHKKNLP